MKTRLVGTILAILTALPVCANATFNSNSIVQYGIEYYTQTDKPVYGLGENVEMLFRVTNLTDETVRIGCSRSPEFNLWVQKDTETIWMLYHGWYWFSPGITLSAGESVDIPQTWDMKDDAGHLVVPGIYDVVGVMYNEPWNYYANGGTLSRTEVPVPITIVPEPSSMVLFVACLSILIRNRRIKHI